ncbi:TRAP transporter small permease [Crassaminicella profunda]|uniref:TRAP transporter small permease n=1 Tax=Crassaminicella profunda TaxID=1286698 RepID=UPI001CA64790|nr:TRAP transporter small permease [Crassaminicella profunda]QZY54673.1 TRAP transporter small permease [Crassaminicella profunda]
MKKMNMIKTVFDYIHYILANFAKVLIILMTVLISIQVFCRYVLGFSIVWSEEIALLMMVWFGFISLAIGVQKKLHISIEFFMRFFPSKWEKVIIKFGDSVVLFFGIIMFIYGIKLVKYGMLSTLPATGLPNGGLYGVLIVSALLIIYDSFSNLLGLKKIGEEN